MQFFAHSADAFCQFAFNEGMNIFGAFDGQAAFFYISKNINECIADFFSFFFWYDLRFSEHFRVCNAGENIVPVEFIVEGERLIEVICAFCAWLSKTTFPQFHNFIPRVSF